MNYASCASTTAGHHSDELECIGVWGGREANRAGATNVAVRIANMAGVGHDVMESDAMRCMTVERSSSGGLVRISSDARCREMSTTVRYEHGESIPDQHWGTTHLQRAIHCRSARSPRRSPTCGGRRSAHTSFTRSSTTRGRS